jgi:hypothetical protein
MLSILSILLLFNSGCAQKQPQVAPPIEVVSSFSYCPSPEKPELPKLDGDSHIGSKQNSKILMEIILDMSHYIKGLENTVKCYENQSVKED